MQQQQQDDLFGAPAPEDVTIKDQIAEVERELRMREHAYPRWVSTGSLTQEKATRQLLCMRAVLDTLRAREGGAGASIMGGKMDMPRPRSQGA